MSLNGLEATEVNDAYQSALGEGGGWFLLKYISRDEVGLLAKGNGGLAEVEEVVKRYEEQSPLYGFIQYRRRKVILKYIPHGTSRLLQARVTVQFQSIIETFSPYDTVFPFAQSTDLRDFTLSSACSLHTATASIKSSNDSLPQKGLAEITEDVSNSGADGVEGRLGSGGHTGDEGQSVNTVDIAMRPEKVNGPTSADRMHHRSTSATTQSSVRPRTISNTDKPLPPSPPSGERTRGEIDPGSILGYGDHSTRPSMDGRFSSNSIRPSTKDLYDAYGYKKKEKMGPRPSNDSGGAPNSSGTRISDFRPVSTLPAGLRMPTRKAVPTRPTSRQAQSSLPLQTSSPVRPNPPAVANSSEKMTPRKIATAPIAPIHIPDRSNSKPTDALRTPRMAELGSPKMTPEKQRLMKALQLRQKQMAAQNMVNGLGFKNMSEEPESITTEIDDSILSAVIDASASTEGHEPVPIATKEIAKERSRLLEDSPISMPETAEEPSTQASSITDEEVEEQKGQENHPTSILPIPEQQGLPDDLANTSHAYSSSNQGVAFENFGKNLQAEAAVTESPKDLSQSFAPMLSELFIADENIVEHEAAGKGSPEPAKYDVSPVSDGQVPIEKELMTAREVREDKEFPPSQLVDGRALKEAHMAGNETVDNQETAPSAVQTSRKDDLQSPSLGDSNKANSIVNTDAQGRVTQTQYEEGYAQSIEHPVRESDESAPIEAPNDVVKPLLARRSSSSPITLPSDTANAHEVPLPPIDEDEEISLGLQQTFFQEQAAATQHPLHTNEESNIATLQAGFPSQNSDHPVTGRTTLNGVGETQQERQFQRQGTVNPIKRVSSPDQSDEQFLFDESFMEELKSATVQEAKPISVSKSPIKPVFSKSESEQTPNGWAKGSRSVSTPVDQSAMNGEILSSPRPATSSSTSRSFSAQQAPRPDLQPPQVTISKKTGVSSSISQRIKALEQISSRPTSPISPNLPPNTSTFLGLRTTSLRTPSSGSEYRNSNFNKSRPDTAYPSPSPSPEIIKSSLLNQQDKTDNSRSTTSATATIFRGAKEKSAKISSTPSEPHHLELQERPFQLELQKSQSPAEQKPMGPPPLSPLKPPRPRFGRYSSTRSGSSSSNEQKLEPPPTTRRDSFASIRSKSSRAGSEVELPRTLSDSSLSGVTSLDGTQDEKKDSRRSRLLKRMSSISSMSRRSIANALSPGPKEAPIIERQEPTQEASSTSVDMGDVNVQFPDNLLWKRRHMVIDEHGVLVLSASKSDNNSKVVTKRYPLSEFHPPYIPEQDRQELPNSVVLDFKDGSTLQCACEHPQGQAGLLKALRHAQSTQLSQS